jgi:hypothetical protein
MNYDNCNPFKIRHQLLSISIEMEERILFLNSSSIIEAPLSFFLFSLLGLPPIPSWEFYSLRLDPVVVDVLLILIGLWRLLFWFFLVLFSVGFRGRRLHRTSVLGSGFSGVSDEFFRLCFFDVFFRARSVLFGWILHDTRLSMVEIFGDRWFWWSSAVEGSPR